MSNKHLTYDDRLTIQAGLQQGLKIAQIAKNIGKDRSTVGREIKAHRRLVSTSKGNNCAHHRTCTRIPNCRSGCFRGKKQCQTACGRCQEGCPDYQEEFCVNNGELVPSARSNCTTLPKQEYRLAGWLYRSATALCQRCEPLFR